MWLTTGPMGRGYLSPVFLPDDGPCLACLLGHFRRLSPMPELHDELSAHARAGGVIEPVPFPDPARAILNSLADWKAAMLTSSAPAVFRLHVLEVSSMDVTSHDVTADPECPACHGRR
jgi:bacteriocin biosynthesis cyclodehydratase domain-containing protein